MSSIEETPSVIRHTKSLILDVRLLLVALCVYLVQTTLAFDMTGYESEYGVGVLIQTLVFEGAGIQLFYTWSSIGLCFVIYGAIKEYYPAFPTDRTLFVLASLSIISLVILDLIEGITYSPLYTPAIVGSLILIVLPYYITKIFNVNINSVAIFLALSSYLIVSVVNFLLTIYPHVLGVYIDSLPGLAMETIMLTYIVGGVFFTTAILLHRLSVVLERTS